MTWAAARAAIVDAVEDAAPSYVESGLGSAFTHYPDAGPLTLPRARGFYLQAFDTQGAPCGKRTTAELVVYYGGRIDRATIDSALISDAGDVIDALDGLADPAIRVLAGDGEDLNLRAERVDLDGDDGALLVVALVVSHPG